MTSTKKFEIDLVKRTKSILIDYQCPWDMCNLINCTLGLIILPYETIKENTSLSFWDKELDKIPSPPPFNLDTFEPIKSIKKSMVTYYPKTMKVLLQKIRNGLAHQKIEPINHGGKFAGVIIRNYFNDAQIRKDLEVYFSQQELKDFALFIADEYLK